MGKKLRLYLSLLGFRRTVYLVVALAAAATVPLVVLRTVAAQAASDLATLTVESAPVETRMADGDWRAAVDGDVLAGGTSVRTGSEGRALLTFFDGSSVELEANAEVALDEISRASGGSLAVRVSQTVGRVWANVLGATNPGSRFEVRTPAATAIVRGTAFTIDVRDGAAKLQVAQGTVQFGVRTIFPGTETTARGSAVALGSPIAPGPGVEFVATNARLTVLDPRLRPIRGFRMGAADGRGPDRAVLAFDYFAQPEKVIGDYTLILRSQQGGAATLDMRALFGEGLTSGVKRSGNLPPGGSARVRVPVVVDGTGHLVFGEPSEFDVLGSVCEGEARDRAFITGSLDQRALELLTYVNGNPGKRIGVVVTNADLEAAASQALEKDSRVRLGELVATIQRDGVHLEVRAGVGPLEVSGGAELGLGVENGRFVAKVRALDLGPLSFLVNAALRDGLEDGLGEELSRIAAGAPIAWDRAALYDGCAGLFGTTQ